MENIETIEKIETEEAPEKDIVIKTENLRKVFPICHSNMQRLGVVLMNKEPDRYKVALRRINLEVRKGENVAVIGNIGSGRTTLLNLLYGITYPTEGTVTINEDINAIMDIRAGFDNELTGRENIVAKCTTLGWTAEEIKEKEEEIIEFSELTDIIDYQMKTYTPGRAARLGFSICVAKPQPLMLVDELASVGGNAYKKKCIQRLYDMSRSDEVTMLYVTAALRLPLPDLCERGLVLKKNKIVYDGPIKKALAYYKNKVHIKGKNLEADVTDADNDDEDDDNDELE